MMRWATPPTPPSTCCWMTGCRICSGTTSWRKPMVEAHSSQGVDARRGRHYLLLADTDLISLAGNADPGAFATLYDRHSRSAYSLAYRIMGERQAAEDLAQD